MSDDDRPYCANGVERIYDSLGNLISIIVTKADKPGVSFYTERELSQQLGCLNHPAGTTIEPHIHNPVRRMVTYTQEVLIIISGVVCVDFYGDDRLWLTMRRLVAGDALVLIRGGHGFRVEEDARIFEVKQGPYVGEHDKTRFLPATNESLGY
jgi:hypothetical protein